MDRNMLQDTRQMLELEAREDGGEALEGYSAERILELHMLYGTRAERAELTRGEERPVTFALESLVANMRGIDITVEDACALARWFGCRPAQLVAEWRELSDRDRAEIFVLFAAQVY